MPHLPIPHFSRSPDSLPTDRRFARRRAKSSIPDSAGTTHGMKDAAFMRTMPLRCALMIVLSMATGYFILMACSPAMGNGVADALRRHFAPGIPTSTAWLRLLGARLPVLCLIAVAGLTRFSGGLTSALLIYRGVCDGGALYAVLALARRKVTLLHPSLPLWGLLLAYGLWMLTDTVLRLAVTISSRRLAARCTAVGDASLADTDTRATLRYHLWRHTAISLGSACGSIVSCLIYASVIL